ncbi:MAG: hypothetical protein IM337_07575 [Microcystis sp. M110S1]|uniref:hypothetical protein n=1 Tax=Microcystis sp. M110S1 TaxID=2771102 RepID=UPI002585B49C|nr:hypothetical protein [Microcystis sp. M110S1]MCA2973861.1 hypothetical protein [Microcystis sp. M110S1]
MATQKVFFSGTFKWAKLNEKNASVYPDDDKGPFCSVDFYFDNKEDLKVFKGFKTRNTVKIDEETGEQFVQFRRYLNHKSIPEFGGVPEVKIKNEEGEVSDFTDLIGNLTKGTIKLSVYDHAYGTACRLEGVLITKLVPYEKKEGGESGSAAEPKVFNSAIPF